MRPPNNGNGRRSRPKERRPQPGHEREPHLEHQTRRTTSTPMVSLPINGLAVKVMAGMVWADLERFRPASGLEAAIARVALQHAEHVYEEAKQLADEVAWLNALIADGWGEGAPA